MSNKQNSNSESVTTQQLITRFNDVTFKEEFSIVINKQFESFDVKLKEFIESSAKITVNNKDELGIAKSRILDVGIWLKSLTATHEKYKKPLLTLGRIVDAKKKELEDKFTTAKTTIISKITFYETLEKRKQEEELLKVQKEKQVNDALVMQDTTRINRMVSNVRAMLYGGSVLNSQGTFYKSGCFTIEEVENVENILSKAIPSIDKFRSECANTYQDAVRLLSEMIAARKTSLLTSSGTVLSDTEALLISDSTLLVDAQEAALKKENRKIEIAIETTQKGFRRTIEYDVFDLNKIPREFLMLDENKITQYKIENRDKILESMKDELSMGGHGFIEGIRFRVSQTSIIR